MRGRAKSCLFAWKMLAAYEPRLLITIQITIPLDEDNSMASQVAD